MLFPLSAKGKRELTPALLKAGLKRATEMGRGIGGDHVGVLQALKGSFPLIPTSELPAWLGVLKTVVSSMVSWRALSVVCSQSGRYRGPREATDCWLAGKVPVLNFDFVVRM